MKGWNYRIIKHIERNKLHEKNKEVIPEFYVWYNLHEVFYGEDDGICCISSDPINAHGETVEELRSDIDMMLIAFEKPVLDYNELLDNLENG